MSTHCCQFCKAEKAEQKEEKAILTGVNDNTDSSENTKESAVRDDSALKMGKTRGKESKEASGHSSGPPKLVKTPRKKSKEKPLSKGVRSPKSKVPAFMMPKVSSNTSPTSLPPTTSASPKMSSLLHPTTASSETNVPHTKSPTIAERMGVLPSPFKHIPSKSEEKQVSTENTKKDSTGGKKKQDSTGENKKQMKEPLKRTEKRLRLPPHSGKSGLTKNAEEVECEKEWYMSKTAMSRHQNTHTEHDGGVLPTVLGCMNRKRMEEKHKEEHPDENVNNPENTVDIFPTKINLAQACNGDGSPQSAAACLTAKAAVRAKIAALDAVKAKEGDIEGATEALRNAAMGKSGRAGKSVAEKEREKEGKKEEKEPPPPPSDGLDKTPPNVPKVKLMPKPKEKKDLLMAKMECRQLAIKGKLIVRAIFPKI